MNATSFAKTLFVKDLKEKDTIAAPFLIKHCATLQGKNGKPYMNVILTDKTGDLEARIWDDVARYSGQVMKDAFVWVEGSTQTFQGRLQLVIKKAQVLREDDVTLKDYLSPSEINADGLMEQLEGYIHSMQDPHYKALAVKALIENSEVRERLRIAPAAKSVHHAYRGGLLEHLVSITRLLDGIAEHYGKWVDRDLLFLGGFFHDIAKIWELQYERTTDYTDEGRLVGHLVMGVEFIEATIQSMDLEFPKEKKLLVKHLVLAHHGRLEYGSPKVPQCLEAVIVHMIDDLDSKVNAVAKFIEQDQNPGRWTSLHKGLERYFWKPEWSLKRSEPL
jgi:3'-5' exoribonuclease